MAAHNETGKRGELLAAEYLAQKGYTILACNYRYGHAEVDIIARAPDFETIVFVEVKTRRTARFGYPEEAAAKPRKQALIVEAAGNYLYVHQLDTEYRFDVVSIILNPDDTPLEIVHFEDAFFPMP